MALDIKGLRKEANCIDVAEYIGIEVVKKGANYFILCPGHEKRKGQPDLSIGNCVLFSDGYICYSCDADNKHDVFEMVQEHLGCSFKEAFNTVADLYGGTRMFQTDGNYQEEKLPISAEDLKLIGLKASGKIFAPINGSYQHFEPNEGEYIQKNETEYLVAQTPSSYSLLSLRKDNEKAFNHLIATKAKETGIKYQKALNEYSSRTSKGATVIYDLFNEDGGVDESVFFGIKNALKKKVWRCKEIYDAFKEK